MDERCKSCNLLCKRLDADDAPARYTFGHLSPRQVITLVESSINRFSDWHHLKVEQAERSTGDQLAVLLKVQYMPASNENHIVLIAQAIRKGDGPTDLWFRYDVPDDCCQAAAARGFSMMITEVLEQIEQSEWLLAKD
jgi:hypothetical protein